MHFFKPQNFTVCLLPELRTLHLPLFALTHTVSSTSLHYCTGSTLTSGTMRSSYMSCSLFLEFPRYYKQGLVLSPHFMIILRILLERWLRGKWGTKASSRADLLSTRRGEGTTGVITSHCLGLVTICSALQKALQQEGDQTDIDLEEMRLIEVRCTKNKT